MGVRTRRAGQSGEQATVVPVSGSEASTTSASASTGAVGLVAIVETPLSVEQVLASVDTPGAGGHAVFVGTVRDHDAGRAVEQLEYTAHPSALAELRSVVAEAAARPGVMAAAAVHRVGLLAIGDQAVVVACAGAHRAEAFEACADLIEALKHRVPIWKEQWFADGTSEWVAGL